MKAQTVHDFVPHASIEDEAASWVARVDAGSLSEDDARHFEEWKNTSPKHRSAYHEAEALWQQMGGLARLFDDAVVSGATDADIIATKFAARARRRLRRSRMATAAMLAMVVPFAGLAWFAQTRDGEYATSVGEVRVVPLADGTTMALNTDSRVTVAYDEQRRSVKVHAGEVYFAVSHDPSRPFTVLAGEAKIRAVGTAFNVRLTGDDVDVLVSEGVVELADADRAVARDAPKQTLRLHRNEQSKYSEGLGKLNQLSPRQMERLLLWRDKRLDFDDQRLVEVIDEIERFTHKRIYFASDELKELRVGGIYEVGDVDNFVLALEDLFPVRVLRVTPYINILVADESKATSNPG